MLWLTYQELLNGQSANMVGFFWMIALVIVGSRRFAWHFQNNGWPQPSHGIKRILWILAVILFAFLFVFLLQVITDEFLTVPIALAFGSWVLMPPSMGAFTIWKLIAFKWYSYLLIAVYGSIFYLSGCWRFCHFTKKSLIWLISVMCYSIFIDANHIFYFLNLSGWTRFRAFYITYPPWRVLLGFFGASLIKKRGVSIEKEDA
jgi:hypothetical protein